MDTQEIYFSKWMFPWTKKDFEIFYFVLFDTLINLETKEKRKVSRTKIIRNQKLSSFLEIVCNSNFV